MADRATVLDILSGERAPAADHALLAALPGADQPAARAIVEALLVRSQRAGLRGLIGVFHELDPSIQQQVLGKMDLLFGVLREASQSLIEQTRLNTLEAIRAGCAYRAAYLVDGALRDRSARVREAAAETLHALADQLLRMSPTADCDLEHLGGDEIRSRMADLASYAEDRCQVVSAVESGLASFSVHLHPRIVEVAMWFVDELGAKFWSLLSAPGSREAQIAINAMTGSRSPRLVPFCMTALKYAEFRPHVVKRLAACTDAAFLVEWLRQSWRLVQPRMAKGMAGVKELSCLKRHGAALLQLPADAQRHIPRWISATGIPGELKWDLLKELQRRGDQQARRAAVWALIGKTGEDAASLLRAIARSEAAELARIARYELGRVQPLEYPPSELGLMPDGKIRNKGVWAETDPPLTFEKYWAMFDQLSEEDRRRFGQQLLAHDSSHRTVLTRRLIEADSSDRVRALCIISHLGIAQEFTDQLYQLSYDHHPMVRSAAVAALGELPNASSKRILRNALIDQDPRVQANAVEAAGRSGDKSVPPELLAKLTSPDNRVRANAVKVLLKLGVREAAETLLSMLQDTNRAQRISALWLIDHMGLLTLATHIVSIADGDEDDQIRERARALSDRLLERGSEPGPPPDAQPEVLPSTP